jgi:hypothetical protein
MQYVKKDALNERAGKTESFSALAHVLHEYCVHVLILDNYTLPDYTCAGFRCLYSYGPTVLSILIPPFRIRWHDCWTAKSLYRANRSRL